MEPSARSNTLFIIDDAEGLLMLFQVVQEGLGRQRLFQIALTPVFIDIVKILGPAPCSRRDRKVALGLQKSKDVVALLPCFFQIGGGALADGNANIDKATKKQYNIGKYVCSVFQIFQNYCDLNGYFSSR